MVHKSWAARALGASAGVENPGNSRLRRARRPRGLRHYLCLSGGREGLRNRNGFPTGYPKSMAKRRRTKPALPAAGESFLTPEARKAPPFPFVLEALAELSPRTNPMFGCLAVYVGEKIVLILRDKGESPDSGVWLATTQEHHPSLRADFPNMRSVQVLGSGGVTGWQVLPVDAADFEEAALHACELIAARDPRIGKVPKARRAKHAAKR